MRTWRDKLDEWYQQEDCVFRSDGSVDEDAMSRLNEEYHEIGERLAQLENEIYSLVDSTADFDGEHAKQSLWVILDGLSEADGKELVPEVIETANWNRRLRETAQTRLVKATSLARDLWELAKLTPEQRHAVERIRVQLRRVHPLHVADYPLIEWLDTDPVTYRFTGRLATELDRLAANETH